jgi:NAD(P)-dependent dehydrogenase (short-subunit alcohol dehydrogenase family)
MFAASAGGSSGVAKEVVKELASRGATVYAGCRCILLVYYRFNLYPID